MAIVRPEFDQLELVTLFNEWMRRYTEHPEEFEAEFRTVSLFLAEQMRGKTPSYGDECVAYLHQLRGSLCPPGTIREFDR